MPSSSKKQHNFMAAVAHSPSFARKVGVPQRVGKDFTAADKGRKFNSGGDNMNPRARNRGGVMKYSGKGNSLVKPGQAPKKLSTIEEAKRQGFKFDLRSTDKIKADKEAADRDRQEKDLQKTLRKQREMDAKTNAASARYTQNKKSGKMKYYAEGGNVYSDEDEGSEQSKKNIADTKVAQSKAEDAKGKLNPESKRGFFGSLFTGRLKDYNAQQKRKKELQSTFGGMKSAKTMEAEKSRADLDKSDKLDFSGGVETKEDVEKRHKEASDKAAASQPKSFKEAFAAAKGKNFTWNGKKYSGAKKASAPKAKTATTKKVDTTVDKRENNRLRQSNPVYWDAAKKVANNKPASSTAPKKPTNPRGSMAGKTASAPAKNARGSMSGFTPSKNKAYNYAAGGSIQAFKKGGLVGSRADGIASRGRTKCKIR